MGKQTFENAVIGDEVESILRGKGTVRCIYEQSQQCTTFEYPLVVLFDNKDKASYTMDGKARQTDMYPELYWPGVQVIPPKPPKRLVKKTITRWTNIYSNGFASFYKTREDAEGSKHHFDYPYVTTVMVTVPYEEEI